MEKAKQHYNPNPMMKANFISKLFYWWLNPLLSLGYKKTLEQEDLFNVLNDDSSDILRERLTREWEKEMKDSGKPSLCWAIFRTVYKRYFRWLIVVSIDEFCRVIQPLLLGQLVSYFTPNSQITTQQAYLYAMGVMICVLLGCLSNHIFFFNVHRMGMQIRIACCSLMFKKMLILNNQSLNKTTTGQIVNLMSNDVNRFDQVLLYAHFFILGPLQAIAIIIILWHILGPVCLLGFLILIFIIPLQVWMGRLVSKYRCKTARFTDQRMALMNEIMAGMRILKMYCWEIPYGNLIKEVRKFELHNIRLAKWLSSIHLCSMDAHYFLIYVTVLISYTAENRLLAPESLFIIMPLMRTLAFSMLFFVYIAIRNLNETKASVQRIQDFLVLEELPAVPAITNECSDNQDPCIAMNNVCASWNKDSNRMALKNISFCVNASQLLAVVGQVGAGKSSLLMSILHELPITSGKLTITGTIGYVAQKPWVFSASLRQNILFGKKYEEKRYKEIIKVCALETDLSIFPNGDFTLVGERGITLSGGQRARVSLARALYMNADIYILDDPLSAVDINVGRHIFNNCIKGFLKDKPCILVTHQLQFLPDADYIMILDQGELVAEGSFDKLLESGVNFAALLNKNDKSEEFENIPKYLSHMELRDTSVSMTDISNRIGSMLSLCSIGNEIIEPEPVQIKAEESETGYVKLNVYYQYMKAGAHFVFVIFTFIAFVISILFNVATDYWIAMWSNKEQIRFDAIQKHNELIENGYNNTNVTILTIDFEQNISIYSALTFGIFMFSLLKAFMFYWSCIQSSKTLHNSMYDNLMNAKISFFDENPVGRILNRFSKDMGLIDDILPSSIVDFLQCFFLTLSIIFVTGVINPYVFIPAFIILVLFVFLRQYYIQTSRSLKRLETTARSPVFSHISSSLEGLDTIRSFKSQQQFLTDFDDFQDIHTEAWFLFIATTRWLSVRLDLLCAFFIFAVVFASIPLSDKLDAGIVGLSVTYSFILTGMFQWFIRQTVDVENNIVSVERVLEYSKLPKELSLDSEESQKPPDDWPQQGAISAQNLYLKYSENSDYILKHLSFKISAQEKIGIVGRSGAGKSTLINVLFRLVEPEGEITIDNIHICSIGLHDLRCKLSIIPQDPVLFKGTLKQNLDPFNEYDDHDLWKSLEDVQLKSMVDDSAQGLDFEICEGGSNLSVGQRQLVCLARAVLRENKILIIDEATANVDLITDALIQNTIRNKFKRCTVLTIAHRLITIMDSDRVMVLENGNIVQFDIPFNLLQSKEGHFYNMVQQTGMSEAEHLIAIAESAMNKKQEEISTSNNIHRRFKTDEINGSVASITI